MTTILPASADAMAQRADVEVLPVLRIVIYARLSQNRRGRSRATAIQVAECEAEARGYAEDNGVRIIIVDKFEEDDVSASRYSGKPRPLYEQVLQLVRSNKVDMIWATEPERLVRRTREMDDLIDLSGETALRYLYFTSDGSFDLSSRTAFTVPVRP